LSSPPHSPLLPPPNSPVSSLSSVSLDEPKKPALTYEQCGINYGKTPYPTTRKRFIA
jgi:hypothetical protein